MKKKLEDFKGTVLKAIAKDIKLKGYSGLNTEELRAALVAELSQKQYKDFDFTKYEAPAAPAPGPIETKKTVAPNLKPVIPTARRRSVAPNSFGRR